jgi:phosphoenolpyruvate---glycerone phosphotransferase subunit DhaL
MEVETGVDAATVKRWLQGAAEAVREQRDYLTQLDAAIGDADHGANMDRGFSAVVEKLEGLGEPPGKLLTTAGSTLVSTVGGASGPLWGTALRKAGRTLGDAAVFGPAELADALEAALAGVVELGAAQEGEKTMVDALAPAVRALRSEVEVGGDLASGLAAAREAAEQGMRATTPLKASKGRASYLGERSIGHQDPGATSTALIIAALERSVTDSR